MEILDPNPADEAKAITDITNLPRSALAAIYHAVTGKVEKLSKSYHRNVVIQYSDIERLYQQLKQQIEHLNPVAPPTETVVIKTSNSKTQTHSSWKHFQHFQRNTLEITSEFTIKIEMLITLPQAAAPQRLIVSVNLDSALPIIENEDEIDHTGYLEFMLGLGVKWRTCNVSVDFVDFLVAQRFLTDVEAWFNDLEDIKPSILNSFMAKRIGGIKGAFSAFGYFGAAVFCWFLAFADHGEFTTSDALYATACLLFLFGTWAGIRGRIFKGVVRGISSNIIPSVVLVTQGDERKYAQITQKRASAFKTAALAVGSMLVACLINLFSSWLFNLWLSSKT